MLKPISEPSTPELEGFVKGVLKAQQNRFPSERRSQHRVPFVYPVLLTVSGQMDSIEAVSMNISGGGVCLISKQPFPESTVAKILIPYKEGRTSSIRSECRWTQDYAAGWHMSGWRFLHLVPD